MSGTNGKPTTFELSQLALGVLAAPDIHSRPISSFEGAAQLALELWEASGKVLARKEEADQQLDELFKAMFSKTHEAWKHHIEAFKGDRAEIIRRLYKTRFSTEEIQRTLFKDTSLTIEKRRIKFLDLAKVGIDHGIQFFGPSWVRSAAQIRDELSQEEITGQLTRWVVSTHQAHQKVMKGRTIPPSFRAK